MIQTALPRYARNAGIFCCLFLAWWFPAAILAGVPSPIEKDLRSVPSKPEKDIDLAETVLLISRQWNPSLKIAPLREELDRLTESVRRRLNGEAPAEAVVEALRQAIHEEGGYRFTERVDSQGIPLDSEELFLHGLLKTKRGYCMNLSLLYLIVGDRLGLPLYGVALPNHFFVRYDSGRRRINIETTQLGAPFDDEFYRRRFGLAEGRPDAFFMRNLNKKETLGAYFSNVGMVYYKTSRPAEAAAFLELATEINPQSIEAQNNLANIYSESDQPEKAIRHYQQALQADPGNVSTLFNLGLTLAETGEDEKAIESFLQVVQIDPAFIPAHRSLVRLFLKKEKLVPALLHLKQLLKLEPGNPDHPVTLGSVYLQMKQFQLALDILNHAKSRFPENPLIREGLGEAYYRMENFKRAVEEYRHLIEYRSEYLKAYVQLGWTYYRLGETKLAAVWTRRGLDRARGPKDMVTLAEMNLGLFSLINRDYPGARSWYQKALASKDPRARAALVNDLKEAVQRFPERPDLEFFTGWVYHQAGEKAQAKPHLKRYLDRNPEGAFAAEAQALLGDSTEAGPAPAESPSPTPSPGASAVPENMVLVPAGFFIRGSNDHGEDEAPERQVYLDAFYIDKYEVSAEEFAAFLNEVNNVKGYYLDNKYGTLFYDGRFHPRKGLEKHPINNVTWYGADAYCRWRKKRLPTEAEWEKAARGTDGRIYPWGNDPPDPNRSRFLQTWTEELRHGVMVSVDSMPGGRSPYGAHNMAGNVKEWVDDWYDREYYDEKSSTINPKGPIGGEFKVLKGGSWRDLRGFLYASFRNNSYPASRLDDYGFRCARSVSGETTPKKLTRRWNPLPPGTANQAQVLLDEVGS